MNGFVYLWYDKKKKMYCLGSHMGDPNDGYITSTGYMKKAYNKRPDDFKRRIIEEYHGDDPKELFALEQKYLDMISPDELCSHDNKIKGTQRYYNVKLQAHGLSGEIASRLRKEYYESPEGEKWRKELSNKWKKDNPSKKGNIPWNKGKECPQISEALKGKPDSRSEEGKVSFKLAMKEHWLNGTFENRPVMSPEKYQEIADKRRGFKQTDYQKQRASEANKGKLVSEETREKLREKASVEYTCPHCGKIGVGPIMKRWHFSNCKHQ